jgi:hypothetical protein
MELVANCARSGQTAGGTPLLESLDVRVGEQQCAMRNVGLARLVEHEAQDVLDLRRATAFDVAPTSDRSDRPKAFPFLFNRLNGF